MPATCGHDMEVPDTMLKRARLGSSSASVSGDSPGQAARMLVPGAITSGLRISRVTWLGPRDEKDGTIGAGFSPVTVRLVKQNDATGYGSERTYAASFSASWALRLTAGRVNAWTTSPSIRQSRVATETSPLPPAFCTAAPNDASCP